MLLLHPVPHPLCSSPPHSQSFPIHCPYTSWSLQCTAYRCNSSVFRFVLNLYLTFYSPAHCLSVNSRDTVTTNPFHMLLSVTPFISQEAQFDWAQLAWRYNPPTPKPISNPSLPCNLHAVWFQLLPKLCLFKYIVPWNKDFIFLREGSCAFLPQVHILIRCNLFSRGSITSTVDSLSTWSCEIQWTFTGK